MSTVFAQRFAIRGTVRNGSGAEAGITQVAAQRITALPQILAGAICPTLHTLAVTATDLHPVTATATRPLTRDTPVTRDQPLPPAHERLIRGIPQNWASKKTPALPGPGSASRACALRRDRSP